MVDAGDYHGYLETGSSGSQRQSKGRMASQLHQANTRAWTREVTQLGIILSVHHAPAHVGSLGRYLLLSMFNVRGPEVASGPALILLGLGRTEKGEEKMLVFGGLTVRERMTQRAGWWWTLHRTLGMELRSYAHGACDFPLSKQGAGQGARAPALPVVTSSSSHSH
jgi:hypothetical protein